MSRDTDAAAQRIVKEGARRKMGFGLVLKMGAQEERSIWIRFEKANHGGRRDKKKNGEQMRWGMETHKNEQKKTLTYRKTGSSDSIRLPKAW